MVGVAAFQVALVFGAPWGAYTHGGRTDGALDTSGHVLAAVSCAILLVMAVARLASAWMREVRADLVASPEDPELLAVEGILAVLLERLERARLGGD